MHVHGRNNHFMDDARENLMKDRIAGSFQHNDASSSSSREIVIHYVRTDVEEAFPTCIILTYHNSPINMTLKQNVTI
jgi:hypothetical protein